MPLGTQHVFPAHELQSLQRDVHFFPTHGTSVQQVLAPGGTMVGHPVLPPELLLDPEPLPLDPELLPELPLPLELEPPLDPELLFELEPLLAPGLPLEAPPDELPPAPVSSGEAPPSSVFTVSPASAPSTTKVRSGIDAQATNPIPSVATTERDSARRPEDTTLGLADLIARALGSPSHIRRRCRASVTCAARGQPR